MAGVIVNCLLGNVQKSFELPLSSNMNAENIKTLIKSYLEMEEEDNNVNFYLTQNGKILQNDTLITDLWVPIIMNFRLLGGKGGFGSMLRAIGAQIEKTTNREACRDLSGRRLRDINEEQRLKKWFAKQKEREEEKEELKRKKLEKLRQFCEGAPLPLTDDPEYNRKRAEMADSIFDAVDKGFETALTTDSSLARATTNDSSNSGSGEEEGPSSSSSSSKEKDVDIAIPGSSTLSANNKSSEDVKKEVVKKTTLKRTFFDEDLDSGDSDDSSDSDTAETSKKIAKVDQV